MQDQPPRLSALASKIHVLHLGFYPVCTSMHLDLARHEAARFEWKFSTVQPRAIMEMSSVTHMKSIPIIANHMPAHVYRYLMLLLRKCFRLSRI